MNRPLLLVLLLACAQAARPDEAEVKDFVKSYFQSWSDKDMDAYAAHFHTNSTVHFISEDGETVFVQIKENFIAGQKEAHDRSPTPMVEVPLSIDLTLTPDGKSAQARVHWELSRKGADPKRGYDLFNLCQVKGQWTIMDLTFYQE